MKYEILNYFFHTPFGSDPWDNFSGTRTEPKARPTLLELLNEFLEIHPQANQIVCSIEIAQRFSKLEFDSTLPFVTEVPQLISLIKREPIWLLADSRMDDTLVGCFIKQSDFGFELSDALEILTQDWTPSAKPRLNTHTSPFSQDQAVVLSFILAQELKRSEIF